VHIFDTREDLDAFISVLSVGLFFVWGLELVGKGRSLAMTISHDEWIEYRFARGEESVISSFEKLIAPSLRPAAQTPTEAAS